MNNFKIRNIRSFFSPSRARGTAFARIALFLSFFGTVCFLVAGWNLSRAVPTGFLTAFLFLLLGECVLKIIVAALLFIRKGRP